eukprot:gene8249-837_t
MSTASVLHIPDLGGSIPPVDEFAMQREYNIIDDIAPGMWEVPSTIRPPKRSYSIGLTISIPRNATSIYVNGAKQSAFFLYELLTFKNRHKVVFINLDSGSPENIMKEWQLEGISIIRYEEALLMNFDIVVEIGMQMRQDQVDRLQISGTKVAAYRSGNNYVIGIEHILKNSTALKMFHTTGYDIMWTLPSYNRSNSFLHQAYNCDVKVAPYLWSPRFFEFVLRQLKTRRYYTNLGIAKRIGVFEPNLNFFKTSVIPIVIAELLYRSHPALIAKISVTNSNDLVHNPDFVRFVQSSISLHKDKRIFFEKRYRFGWFLSEFIDVVLSHQWENELNYLHIEALYAGYPLVHNSPFFQDCGYFYPEDDGHIGREKLKEAILTHDLNILSYNKKAKECVWRHSTVNPENIYAWDALLDELYEGERSPELKQRLEQGLANKSSPTDPSQPPS